MTYNHNVFSVEGNTTRLQFAEKRQAVGRANMTNDVIMPSLMAWALFLLGSLGLSFVIVSARLVPTQDEIISMLGIALGVSSLSTLLTFGALLDRYQARLWNVETSEYETLEAALEADNLTQRITPTTTVRSRIRWTAIQQRDLALKCFTPSGVWAADDNLTDELFNGVIPNYKHKYKALKQDFLDAGWIEQTTPNRYRWTEDGKSAIWRWYPR
jgi:hypothetical protein